MEDNYNVNGSADSNVNSDGGNAGNNPGGYTNNSQSCSSGYSSNYSGGNSNGYRQDPFNTQGSDRGGKKKGGFGRAAALTVLGAAVLGVGAGAGYYGFSSFASNSKGEAAEEGEEASAVIGKENEEDTNEIRLTRPDTEEEAESASGIRDDGETELNYNGSTVVVTDVTDVAESVLPSVVSVYNNYITNTRDFWGQVYSQEATSTGSGIIIAKTEDELLIVTNNHVVEGEESMEVKFMDDSTVDALLKGTDSDMDLAVIAVKLEDIDEDTLDVISVATLGSSDNLKIGEPAIVIGNALGYGQSVTTGVISALNREIPQEDGSVNTFIQTDAAINPGNSGGALVNIAGEVVGIPSNKIGATTVEGMGYAIPIDNAIPIIEDLMNQRTKAALDEDQQGYLGISGASVTSQVAQTYNMPTGVYVAQIMENGGAAKSELQKGDIITKVEKTKVSSMEDLKTQLQYYAAGETVELTIQRADGSGEYSEMTVTVKLGDKSTIETDDDAQEQENDHNAQPGQRGNIFNFGY